MLGNESSSSDREKSPSLMRSNNDQGRRNKEVSPKVGESLKEHLKRKRPKSRSKSSNDRSTDEERNPSPKRSSSSNDDSDKSKYRNNEGQESTDSRFRVISEEHQYKYSLPPDMVQYAFVNFDTYVTERDLINAALIKNPVPENINPMKTLDYFAKDILEDKRKENDLRRILLLLLLSLLLLLLLLLLLSLLLLLLLIFVCACMCVCVCVF